MKSAGLMMAGNALTLARFFANAFLLAALVAVPAQGQALYKYRGPDGEWIYSDRKPFTDTKAEVRELPRGEDDAGVDVFHSMSQNAFRFIADNMFHAPVEVIIGLDSLDNLSPPSPEQDMRWIVPARSRLILMQLDVLDPNGEAKAEYRYAWLPGEPGVEHQPAMPYRAPFAVAGRYPVSQAFPVGITHVTPDSYYAVDVAMPEGTDIYAARAGTVFQVASTNFRSGDPAEQFSAANVVQILHDDGTFAIYGHLNWDSIRVRPGDLVERGEFIAESGNTGFSSGPHLHFAVLRNRGMGLESVPVVFTGPSQEVIDVQTGDDLTAY